MMRKKRIRLYRVMERDTKDSSYYSGTYMHIDDSVRMKRYRFIKSYEHFVLVENIDNGCRECFSHADYNRLEVINGFNK